MPDPVSRLPEVVRHPSVARAAISPSAIAVTGAGVGLGVWDHSLLLAVVLGVGAWAGRMAVAISARARRRRAARPRPIDIDPWGVPEPWRQSVRDALSAQTRFDRLVAGHEPGPARDRLGFLQVRVHEGTEEVWALANQAASLAAASGPDRSVALSAELQQLQAERARLQARRGEGAPPSDRLEDIDRTEAAVAAQLHAARRAQTAGQRATDRLRTLTARLDEAVTSLVELTLDGDGGFDSFDGSAGAVGAVVDEIGSLHQAMLEAGQTPSGPSLVASPTPSPTTPPAIDPPVGGQRP